MSLRSSVHWSSCISNSWTRLSMKRKTIKLRFVNKNVTDIVLSSICSDILFSPQLLVWILCRPHAVPNCMCPVIPGWTCSLCNRAQHGHYNLCMLLFLHNQLFLLSLTRFFKTSAALCIPSALSMEAHNILWYSLTRKHLEYVQTPANTKYQLAATWHHALP